MSIMSVRAEGVGALARKTYVLWDLDEGEGVFGGLGWQGPGAEGWRDDGQTGGRHNFSLRNHAQTNGQRGKISLSEVGAWVGDGGDACVW